MSLMIFASSKENRKCFTSFNVFVPVRMIQDIFRIYSRYIQETFKIIEMTFASSKIYLKHIYFNDFMSLRISYNHFVFFTDFVSARIILKHFICFNDFVSFRIVLIHFKYIFQWSCVLEINSEILFFQWFCIFQNNFETFYLFDWFYVHQINPRTFH